MTLADILANDPVNQPSRAKMSHPTGWEPHVEEAGQSAAVVTQPTEQDKDDFALLEDSGLDPAHWKIDGQVQVRRWQQTADGPWLRYYRFNAVRGTRLDGDVKAIIRQVSGHRFTKPKARGKVRTARVVCLSDWQAGKGQGGGSEALVKRLLDRFDQIRQELVDNPVDELLVVGLGDLVEGCAGHYAMQEWEVDLDRRQQVKLVRRLLIKALHLWAPVVPRMVVACVPGNHGENRRAGKAFTTFGDNDDVAVFEQAKEILDANPKSYGHVRFAIPDNELVVTLDVAGTIVAFAHGHQFRSGQGAQNKAFKWWEGQSLGRQAAADADVLVSGHYHHFQHINKYGRTWLQAPAMDGGSQWWTNTTGQHDDAGLLTFLVTSEGVDHVRVL